MKTLLALLVTLSLATAAFAQLPPPPRPVNCVTYCTSGGICVTTCT